MNIDGEDSDEGSVTSQVTSESGRGQGRGRYHRGGRGRGGRGRRRGGAPGLSANQRSGSYSSLTGSRDHTSARDRTQNLPDQAPVLDNPDKIFNIVLQKYGGRVKYGQFRPMLPRDTDVKQWVADNSSQFVLFENNAGFVNHVAIRVPKAKMCNFYSKQGCTRSNCTYFHLCISHVCGRCEYGVQCSKQHHFQGDAHNQRVLRELRLTDPGYSEDDLKTIIRQSSLHVCANYNQNRCQHEDACARIHVCSEFVMKKTCSREGCDLDHDFTSAHSVRLLKSFGHVKHLNDVDVIRRSLLIDRDTRSEQRGRASPARGGGGGQGQRGSRGGRGPGYRSNSRPRHRDNDTLSVASGADETGSRAHLLPVRLPSTDSRNNDDDVTEGAAGGREPWTPEELTVRPQVKLRSGYNDEEESAPSRAREEQRQRLDDREDVTRPMIGRPPSEHERSPRITRPPSGGVASRYRESGGDDGINEKMRDLGMNRNRGVPHLMDMPILPNAFNKAMPRPVPPLKPRITPVPVSTALHTPIASPDDAFHFDEAKTNYICDSRAKAKCLKGSLCRDQHYSKSYCWVISAFGEDYVLSGIEDSYRNPDKSVIVFKLPQAIPGYGGTVAILDFKAMMATSQAHPDISLKVRRYSTRSKAEDPHGRHATVWRWSWQQDDGQFTEYDVETAIALELAYVGDKKRVRYTRGEWTYEIDFSTMMQTNLSTGKARAVARRPSKT